MNSLSSVVARLRGLLVVTAVLAGLLVPFFAGVGAADAAKHKHRTCNYAMKHAKYRAAHPYWWTHHCPKKAAALAARSRGASPVTTSRPAATIGTSSEQYIANAVLNTLNSERRANGLAPLTMDPQLVLAARRHNLQMARYNQMSHQLPSEPGLGTRLDAVNYRWTWAGENVAWNSVMTTQGVLTLQNMMYNEKAPNDGHRQNILSRNFQHVGVNVYMDTAHHKVWLTTDFGHK